MRFLLDTNVLSEIGRKKPSARVSSWLVQNELACGISDLVIGEMFKGAYRLSESKRRESTLRWIGELEAQFEGRLVPLDLPVLKRWGELCGESEAGGRRLPVLDSLMAATALTHELILVTRNRADFSANVRVLDPWG